MTTWERLKSAKISAKDTVIGGVCGALGGATDVPAWMYRAAFLFGLLAFGVGLVLYLVLWICIPRES